MLLLEGCWSREGGWSCWCSGSVEIKRKSGGQERIRKARVREEEMKEEMEGRENIEEKMN